jgi:RNA polymerase sporulation-specific sigma factor
LQSSVDDETLVAQMKQGSEESFDVLLSRYDSLINKKARLFSGASVDSDDLIQECKLALFCAADSFNESLSVQFKTYASHCMENRLISAVRSANRRKHRVLTDSVSFEGLDAAAEDGNPEATMFSRLEADSILRKVDSVLSGNERRIFMLYLSGYSYSEVAAMLVIPEKSVDNALQRARRKLRSALSDYSC